MLFVRLSSTMFPFFKKILHLEFENGLNLTQLTPVDPSYSCLIHVFCKKLLYKQPSNNQPKAKKLLDK